MTINENYIQMRNFISLLIFITLPTLSSFSQDDDFKTIFNGKIERISGFGGPIYSYTIIDNRFSMMTGGGGAVLLNDFFIGGFGVSTVSGVKYNANTTINLGYGGLWYGYSYKGNSPIHPSFQLRTGWGIIKSNSNGNVVIDDNIFVVEPCVEAEFNVAKFFRIAVGGSYRIVGGLDQGHLTTGNMSGPAAIIVFRFGWFK